jgi:SAM-dependent methyltransferase
VGGYLLMASLPERILSRLLRISSRILPVRRLNLSNFPQSASVLNLGCGANIHPGWINIDAGIKPSSSKDGTVVINYDLRRGLPFEDGCIDVVYSSHFFEHLNTTDGFALMKHCLRVLKKGGVFRAAVPDARIPIRAYMEGDLEYFAKASNLLDSIGNDLPTPELRSAIDHIDLTARGWEHRALYDPDKMTRLLSGAGFVDVKVVSYDPAYDLADEIRRVASFYIEARKT